MASITVGVVGLGRMGAAIAYRLAQAGHAVIGFDPSDSARAQAQGQGIVCVDSLEQIFERARVFWLMVPPGDPVDATLKLYLPHARAGDIIIDGGNNYFKDSMRRAQMLASHGITFLDCGTSGGLHGRELGFCLMVGGDKKIYEQLSDVWRAVAAPDGFAYMGPSGTGHYVKMVHNGIEYALLQAYAEGFQLIKEGSFASEHLNLEEIARVWNQGSIIRSWILQLADDVLKRDQDFNDISGTIAEGGTGRWTMEEGKEHTIPLPVIEESLQVRAWSRQTGGNYATKLVALLRHEFGGHAVQKKEGKKNENY